MSKEPWRPKPGSVRDNPGGEAAYNAARYLARFADPESPEFDPEKARRVIARRLHRAAKATKR
jgi:hypothetical protein